MVDIHRIYYLTKLAKPVEINQLPCELFLPDHHICITDIALMHKAILVKSSKL